MGYCASMRDSKFFVEAQHTGIVLAKTKEWAYDFELDETGNVTGIEFLGEKVGEDYWMFQSIAPYVKDGSFIEMLGEDGEQWRWVFKDGNCREITAKVSWEE